MARVAVLLLVVDLVVRNTKTRAEDVLKERLEPNIKVVGHDIQVVLDVRPDDLLVGLVVAYKIVYELQEVLLEVVLLYIYTAQGKKDRYYRQ